MKKSNYNYEIHNANKHLIYNTLHSTCIMLDNAEYTDYSELNNGSYIANNMVNLGFWIEDGINEFEYALLSSRIRIENNDKVIIRIYTTLNCNAKCAYCFENKTRENISINETGLFTSFIKQKCLGYKSLVIEWFGGEPLLNTEAINIICDEIKTFCEDNRIEFYSKMITNGYLLGEVINDKSFDRWNLKSVQITLDGPKEKYEKIKKFGDENSFDVVIDNISNAIDNGIYVIIRLNYHYKTVNDTIELIKFLNNKFKNRDNITVYAKHIFVSNSADFEAVSNADTMIFDELYRNGFVKDIISSIPDRKYKCIAYLTNAYVLYPDGRIGKCSQAMAENDFIGDTNHISLERMAKWCNNQVNNKCRECKLFPLCNGGCKYEELHSRDYCMIDESLFLHKLNLFLNSYIKQN